jgi:hypothetical protein
MADDAEAVVVVVVEVVTGCNTADTALPVKEREHTPVWQSKLMAAAACAAVAGSVQI